MNKNLFLYDYIKSYWLRNQNRTHSIQTPQVKSVDVNWGYRIQSLPAHTSVLMGTRYGSTIRNKKLRSKGCSSVRKSQRFVASMRLKKGDPVSIHTRVYGRNGRWVWMIYTLKNKEIFSWSYKKSRQMKTQSLSVVSPRSLIHLRDYYDVYRPLGHPSQVTVNISWSGLKGSDDRKWFQHYRNKSF